MYTYVCVFMYVNYLPKKKIQILSFLIVLLSEK